MQNSCSNKTNKLRVDTDRKDFALFNQILYKKVWEVMNFEKDHALLD